MLSVGWRQLTQATVVEQREFSESSGFPCQNLAVTSVALSTALTLEAQQRSGKNTGVSKSEKEGKPAPESGKNLSLSWSLLGKWPVAEDGRMSNRLWDLKEMATVSATK